MQRLEPLRKCRICGLEAYTEQDLEKFTKFKRLRHGRNNLCKECHNSMRKESGKYWSTTKRLSDKWHAILDLNKIWFKKKRIYLNENPRTNVCSECGRRYPEELKIQTSLHHNEYNENNPLTNTRELCQSCHMKLHYRRGDLSLIHCKKGNILYIEQETKK